MQEIQPELHEDNCCLLASPFQIRSTVRFEMTLVFLQHTQTTGPRADRHTRFILYTFMVHVKVRHERCCCSSPVGLPRWDGSRGGMDFHRNNPKKQLHSEINALLGAANPGGHGPEAPSFFCRIRNVQYQRHGHKEQHAEPRGRGAGDNTGASAPFNCKITSTCGRKIN